MTTLSEAAPEIKALQAEGKGPAPCARFCESKAFQNSIRQAKRGSEVLQAKCDAFLANVQLLEVEIEDIAKERDALRVAGKLALDMCVEFSRAPMTQVEYLNLLRTIGALKSAGVPA